MSLDLSGVDWKPTGQSSSDGDVPIATHEGTLEILGRKFRCYRLSDGRAVIHADDMNEFLCETFGDSP